MTLGELVEEKEDAEEVRIFLQKKMLNGASRDGFIRHLIENEEKIDALTAKIRAFKNL